MSKRPETTYANGLVWLVCLACRAEQHVKLGPLRAALRAMRRFRDRHAKCAATGSPEAQSAHVDASGGHHVTRGELRDEPPSLVSA